MGVRQETDASYRLDSIVWQWGITGHAQKQNWPCLGYEFLYPTPWSLSRNRWLRCVEKVPKCWIFSGLARLVAFLARVSAGLMAGRVEIETPIVVLLTMWRAGVPIVKLNGKSRAKQAQKSILILEGGLLCVKRVF